MRHVVRDGARRRVRDASATRSTGAIGDRHAHRLRRRDRRRRSSTPEMSADYGEVRERSSAAASSALGERDHVRVTTPAGTDCTFDSSGRSWQIDDGRIDEPRRVRQPARRRGLHRADRDRRRGRLRDRLLDRGRRRRHDRAADPASVRATAAIVDGRGRPRGRRRCGAVIAEAGSGADIVAELGIGTNDQARHHRQRHHRREGRSGTAHVAFGDNTGSYGGDNEASIHVDGVMADASIEADGRVVMSCGQLV